MPRERGDDTLGVMIRKRVCPKQADSLRDATRWIVEMGQEGMQRSDVVPSTLLQLDQPPTSGLGVADILGQTCDTNGVSDLLDLVFHTRSQFTSLLAPVNVHLLCAAHDDEDWNVTRFKQTCVEDINISDIHNTTVRLETLCGVLLHQCGVNLVLGSRQPLLEDLDITLDIGVQHLGQNVIAHLCQEWLDLEGRIHLTELLDDHGHLVLSEETGDPVRDTTGGADEWVLGFGVGALKGEETLHGLAVITELSPRLLPLGVLVEGDIYTSARNAG